MEQTYTINKKAMALMKKMNGRCLCNTAVVCPCKEFLEEDKCKCKLYQLVVEKAHISGTHDIVTKNKDIEYKRE